MFKSLNVFRYVCWFGIVCSETIFLLIFLEINDIKRTNEKKYMFQKPTLIKI